MFENVQVITTKNSSKSIDELLTKEDNTLEGNWIHRKNKGNTLRWNPKFKSNVLMFDADNPNACKHVSYFSHTNEAGELRVFFRVSSKAEGFRPVKAAHMKATSVMELIDSVYHTAQEGEEALPLTNRYDLKFVHEDTEKDFLFFEVIPAEEQPERVVEISDERREELREQIKKYNPNIKSDRAETVDISYAEEEEGRVSESVSLDNSPEVSAE